MATVSVVLCRDSFGDLVLEENHHRGIMCSGWVDKLKLGKRVKVTLSDRPLSGFKFFQTRPAKTGEQGWQDPRAIYGGLGRKKGRVELYDSVAELLKDLRLLNKSRRGIYVRLENLPD